jgi:protein-disulfide isomerase
MAECKYCEEEFESEEEMHLHWGEEHEDELNSHDKEKVKKARREREEAQKTKKQKRRKIAGKALAIGGALIVAVVLGQQALSSMGGQTADLDLEGQPMEGNENANVTVVEFGDYQCPYCKQFDQNTHSRLKENYIDTGEVKFYYVNYAFLGQGSTDAAVASECVYDQTGNSEQFWNFHHGVFDRQGAENSGWVTTVLMMEIARDTTEGLDYEGLRQCIDSQETLDQVQSERRMGSSNGVTGTPAIYVNGESVPNNDYASIRAAIEQELG